MKWAKLSFNILFSVVAWIASVYSLFELGAVSYEMRPFVISLVAVLTIVYIGIQINSFRISNCNRSVHRNKDKVNQYLLNWLNKGSRTVIFTRDLTWANESGSIRKTLEEKARNRELTICLYRKTETTNFLEKLGAEVYVHNLPENQLKSRFTIIDYGTNNPKITVGTRNSNGWFVNERYDMNTNPNALHAFIELFELVKSRSTGG